MKPMQCFSMTTTVYFIYYDVYPPYTEFANRTGRVSGQVGKGLAATGEPFLLFVGGLFLIPSAAVATIAERVDHSVDQHSQAATHIDLMVISPKSDQGIVRRVSAYPDGRVDEKPWAAWAQMKAP